MAVDPVETSTVVTGGGAAALLSAFGTWGWRAISRNSRAALRVAAEAKEKADTVERGLDSLRAEFKLEVSGLRGEVQRALEQGRRNEIGIAEIKTSIEGMYSAWSADRTVNAGLLGRLTGLIEAQQSKAKQA